MGTPADRLQSDDFTKALEAMGREFDWVVIDSPPLTPFAETATLASLADAIVLVTRKGATPKAALTEGLKAIDKSKIIATVFNGSDQTSHKYYYEYYRRETQSAGPLPASRSSRLLG